MDQNDLSWKLIHTYFEDKGYVKSQINSFNELMYKFIPEVIQRLGSFSVTQNQVTYTYNFRAPIFGLPHNQESDGEYRFITPSECRLRSLNYQSPIWCDLDFESKTPLSTTKQSFEKILVGYVPTMLKSELCCLKNKTPNQLAELGECMYEHGGYFIVNGGEKVLIAQERMAHNQVFCYLDNKTGDFTSELRSVPEGVSKAATQVVVRYLCNKGSRHIPTSTITVQLHYTRKGIPLVIVFRALGIMNNEDIIRFIDPSAQPEIVNMLQASFDEASFVDNVETALQYIGSNTTIPLQSAEKQIEYARNNVIMKEMFPHLGHDENIKIHKAYLLGHMVYKCLLTAQGKRDPDDRDHFGNKRLDLAGNLIGNIFRIAFTRVIKDFKKLIEKRLSTNKAINYRADFDYKTIEKSLRHSISTGNWGNSSSAKNARTGVSQPLHRLTYISTLSHIRRLVAPIAKEGKLPKPRQLHNSLWARACSHETPEGNAVGLIKNLSMLSEISVDTPSAPVRDLLAMQHIQPVTSLSLGTKVFVNGVCLGTTHQPEQLYTIMKEWKLTGQIQYDVSIVYNQNENEINVMTDGARSIRPLLYIANQEPEEFYMKLREALKQGKRWNDLCKMQLLEYVDGREEEHVLTALRFEDWVNERGLRRYTHLEIEPSMLLGVCASSIPLSDHNPAPRVTYQSSQMKQALGVFALNYRLRYDTQAHVMWYPQKPLIAPKMAKLLKVGEMPAGQQCIVAIACFTGFNQEDSIIMNRAVIDRGMFRTTYYRSYTDSENKNVQNYEEFCIPEEAKKGTVGNKRYELLDEDDGLVTVGAKVSENDVIVGKVTPVTSVADGGTESSLAKGKVMRKDTSMSIKKHEEGIVDSVLITSNEHDKRMVKIRLRKTRIPEVGDKLACIRSSSTVLTTNGWISIADITMDHEVCVLDPVTDNIRFEHPERLHSYDHKGKMYKLRSQLVDLYTTPNHRMWVKRRDRDAFEFRTAEEIYGKRVNFKKTVQNFVPADPIGDRYVVPAIPNYPEMVWEMNDWLTFLGIWIAEGYCASRVNDNSIGIAVHKQRVRDALTPILQRMNLNSNYPDNFNFRFSNKQLATLMRPWSLGAANKFLPEFCWRLTKEQSRVLIAALMLGDGHVQLSSNNHTYSTSSQRLTEDISRLAIQAGYSTHTRVQNGRTAGYQAVKKDGTVITYNHDNYTVTIIKTKLEPQINHGHINSQNGQSEEWEDYDGKVYCLTVSTGIFLIQENGKPVFTGNSRHAQSKLKRCYNSFNDELILKFFTEGTIGMTFPQEDMPFTREGITPDIVINPHGYSVSELVTAC